MTRKQGAGTISHNKFDYTGDNGTNIADIVPNVGVFHAEPFLNDTRIIIV